MRGGIWPSFARALATERLSPTSVWDIEREGRDRPLAMGLRGPILGGLAKTVAKSSVPSAQWAEKSGEGSVCPDARPHQLSSPLFRPLNLTRPKRPVRVFHDESLRIAHELVAVSAKSAGDSMGRSTGHP